MTTPEVIGLIIIVVIASVLAVGSLPRDYWWPDN